MLFQAAYTSYCTSKVPELGYRQTTSGRRLTHDERLARPHAQLPRRIPIAHCDLQPAAATHHQYQLAFGHGCIALRQPRLGYC